MLTREQIEKIVAIIPEKMAQYHVPLPTVPDPNGDYYNVLYRVTAILCSPIDLAQIKRVFPTKEETHLILQRLCPVFRELLKTPEGIAAVNSHYDYSYEIWEDAYEDYDFDLDDWKFV